MKRLWLIVAGVVAIGVVTASALVLAPKPPIPPAVKKEAASTLLVPQTSGAVINRSTVRFDDKLKLISLVLAAYGTNMVVSEQPSPDSFSDIPLVYDKVVAQMQEYQKFDVDVGTVHLTRPPQLAGKQAAVINTKGTLLFAKPERDLSEDQWRKFFASFVVDK